MVKNGPHYVCKQSDDLPEHPWEVEEILAGNRMSSLQRKLSRQQRPVPNPTSHLSHQYDITIHNTSPAGLEWTSGQPKHTTFAFKRFGTSTNVNTLPMRHKGACPYGNNTVYLSSPPLSHSPSHYSRLMPLKVTTQ